MVKKKILPSVCLVLYRHKIILNELIMFKNEFKKKWFIFVYIYVKVN